METKNVVIAAGTGFLGQVLCRYFVTKGYTVTVLTRGAARTENGIDYVTWDARTRGRWEEVLEGAFAVINLAGKSVDCRYDEKNRKEILASRIDSTKVLGAAIRDCKQPPRHWLNAATATIYRHSEDKRMDEETGEIGHDFSMDVAQAWEAAFFEADTPLTRKTALRTAIVLGKGGGAFPPLKRLVAMGFGGKQGSGRQYISWMHEADFASAVAFIIEGEMEGVVNLVAPDPIRNADFMRALRKAMGVRWGLPLTKQLLEFGASVIGTETELVLKSRNVVPVRLQEAGFHFQYGSLGAAFQQLTR